MASTAFLSKPPTPPPPAGFSFGVFGPRVMDLVGTVGMNNPARVPQHNSSTTNTNLKSSEIRNEPGSSPPSGQIPTASVQAEHQTEHETSSERPALQHPQPRKSPVSSQVLDYQDEQHAVEKSVLMRDHGQALPETPAIKSVAHDDNATSRRSSTTMKHGKKSGRTQQAAQTVPSSMTKPGDDGVTALSLAARDEQPSPIQDKNTAEDLGTADAHGAIEPEQAHSDGRAHSATPNVKEHHQEHLEELNVQPQAAAPSFEPVTAETISEEADVHSATPFQPDMICEQPEVHGKQQTKSSKSLARVDDGKIQKPKPKTKSKSHRTLQNSEVAFMEWKRLKEAEELQAVQNFRESLAAKEYTINVLRRQNESLSEGLLKFDNHNKSLQTDLETKQALLLQHQQKIYTFAKYMSSLDTDIPAMKAQQRTIDKQLRTHLNTDHDALKSDIAASRASIDRIRTKYQSVTQTLQAEMAHALQQTTELRKQLGDNAGQLAEERDRSMRLEKQLKLATGFKDSIMQELAKIQDQIEAFGPAVKSVSKQADQIPTNSDDQTLIDAANADIAATSEKVNSMLTELQGIVRYMSESHAKRLDELKKHQEALVSAETPLEQRLNESIDKMSKTLGEMQTLQQRNESLCVENVRISQQLMDKDGKLSDLVKERDSLISIRTLLEEKAHKAAEDLAVMQERMMGLANQKPVTGDELQAALLRGENLSLRAELELLKESRQRGGAAHQDLLQQIETLKKQLMESEEKCMNLESAHALAVETTAKEHNENIEKVKQEMSRNFNAVQAQNNMNYRNEKKQLSNAKSGLEVKLKDAESDLEELRAKLNTLEQSISTRDADKQLLQEQREQERRAVIQLKEQIKAFQDEVTQLKKSSQLLNKANEDYKKAEAVKVKQLETLRAKVTALETASTQAQEKSERSDQELSSVRKELRNLQDERQDLGQAKQVAETELKEAQAAQQQQALAAKSVLDKLRQDKDDESSKLRDEIARLQSLLKSRQEANGNGATEAVSRVSTQRTELSMSPTDARREVSQVTRTKTAVSASGQKRKTAHNGSSQTKSQTVADKAVTQQVASQARVQVVDSQRLTQRSTSTRDESPDGTFDDLPDFAPEALESSRQPIQDTQSTFVPPKTFEQINNRVHQSSTPLSSPRDDTTPPASRSQQRRSSGPNEFAMPGVRHESNPAVTPLSGGSRAGSRQDANMERPRSNTGNKLTSRTPYVQFTDSIPLPSSSQTQSTQRSSSQFKTTQNTQFNANKDAYSYEFQATPPQQLKPSLKRKPADAPALSDKRHKPTQDSGTSIGSQGRPTSSLQSQSPNTPARAPQRTSSGKKTAKSSQTGQRPAVRAMSKVRSSTPATSQSLSRSSTTRVTTRTSSYDLRTGME